MINFQKAEFVRSAIGKASFFDDGRPQAVFAGRSNVGKSSLINMLLKRKNLARVSASPGKTAHINFFDIDKKLWLVDLPGYGYAKVSNAEKLRWAKLMEEYFASGLISMGVLIVDIRHKPTGDDKIMANWFKESGVPMVVAANKSDKLKKSEIALSLERIKAELELGEGDRLICCSAEKGEGRDEILRELSSLVK